MKFTSELIKKAWVIRKEAAAKFDCPVMEIHFGLCIEMAKAEINGGNDMIEKLEKFGGKRWEKNGMDRVYINGDVIAKLIDFEYTTYKTGNISSAALGDEGISNSKAKKIRSEINYGKCFYDVNSDEWVITGMREFSDIVRKAVEKI